MEGLVKEGAEVMEEDFEDAVLDAGLIGAARRVEHYEMAAYGAVCEIAKVLGQTKHASLLEKTLAEEKQTDQKLAEAREQTSTSKPTKKVLKNRGHVQVGTENATALPESTQATANPFPT